MAGLIFSWLFAAMTLVLLMLSYVYARYTRDKIGYLTIMLTAAFIPIAVWTAISPDTISTPLFWLAVMLVAVDGAVINIVNEAFDPEVKAFFIRPTPFTEMLLYIFFIIGMFFLGTTIFFYAALPWPYLLALTAVTGWGLTAAKFLGGQRSSEDLKKAFMILVTHTAIYWLSTAVFLWIK
jgi:hypothetical protein